MDFPASNAELSQSVASITGAIASGGSSATNVVDVRGAASFYLAVSGVVPGNSTDWDPLEVTLRFYIDKAKTTQLFTDQHCFFADSGAGAALVNYGPWQLADAFHGPYMDVTVKNLGPDSVNVSAKLYSTNRTMTQPYANQGNNEGDLWLISPTVGAVTLSTVEQREIPARYGYGRFRWRISTTLGCQINWFAAGDTIAYASFNDSVGIGNEVQELLGSKRAMLARLNNTTGTNTVFLSAVQELRRV